MEHRGACGGDSISGDGAGIMTQIPWKLFDEFRSEDGNQPGVGMIFLPRDETKRNAVKDKIEKVISFVPLDLLLVMSLGTGGAFFVPCSFHRMI